MTLFEVHFGTKSPKDRYDIKLMTKLFGKELLKNIPSLTCYMAARDVENLSGHSALLGMELGRSETKIKIL